MRWHRGCVALSQRRRTLPDKGTPVARRGRKATGQDLVLTAGLPKEGSESSPGTGGLPHGGKHHAGKLSWERAPRPGPDRAPCDRHPLARERRQLPRATPGDDRHDLSGWRQPDLHARERYARGGPSGARRRRQRRASQSESQLRGRPDGGHHVHGRRRSLTDPPQSQCRNRLDHHPFLGPRESSVARHPRESEQRRQHGDDPERQRVERSRGGRRVRRPSLLVRRDSRHHAIHGSRLTG